MKCYKICSCILELDAPLIELGNAWSKFEITKKGIKNNELREFYVGVFIPQKINQDLSIIAVDNDYKIVLANDHFMIVKENYSIAYFQNKKMCNIDALLNHFFYSNVIRQHIIQLHCSVVDYMNKGIIFIGPSGIGKTTQAELWAKHRNATIINGDTGMVQQIDTEFLAWGTPWHGSSSYCVNTSVPLKAIVVLKQASYNSIRRLSGFEMVKEVSRNVFYPTWLEDGVFLCTDILNRLLESIPVYRLDNLADEASVNLVYEELNSIL